MLTLHGFLGVKPEQAFTTLLVHSNITVYAMAYWMTMSLLPYLTTGSISALSSYTL
jgi:hypothetical protein